MAMLFKWFAVNGIIILCELDTIDIHAKLIIEYNVIKLPKNEINRFQHSDWEIKKLINSKLFRLVKATIFNIKKDIPEMWTN